MGSSSDSEAIQFIDSASRHGSIEDLLTILNVQVAFLPNRCTSKTRPLVARSTACIKRRHRKKMKALDLIDENNDASIHLLNVDVLTSTNWIIYL